MKLRGAREVIILQAFKSVLQIIFYLIWTPLGLFLFALIIFLIVANPLERLGQGGPGGFGQGGPPGEGQFGPAGQ